MFEYTKYWVNKVLFNTGQIGEIYSSDIWTSEYLEWDESNKNISRNTKVHEGIEVLKGNGKVRCNLVGGCIEVLEMIKGTKIWPEEDMWNDAILFLETSEDTPSPTYLEYWLRNYGSQGILQKVNGIIFGKPYDNKYYEEYKNVITKVIRDELNLRDLAIMYNMSFGHTDPMMIIPYGALAEIDCRNKKFSI